MKGLSNNKKGNLTDFMRYIRGEMTNREENKFQRYLQGDPFAEEAEEGFSEFSHTDIEKDLKILDSRLKNHISKRRRIVWYRIAASVAVLMIIGSVWMISTRNKPVRELRDMSQIEKKSGEFEAEKKKEDVRAETSEEAATNIDNKSQSVEVEDALTASDAVLSENNTITDVQLTAGEPEPANSEPIPEYKDEPVTAEIAERPPQPDEIQARYAVAEENNDAVQGIAYIDAPDSSAKSLIPAAAAGVAEKSMNAQSRITAPAPVDGETNFQQYIRDNIRIPDSIPQGQEAEVSLEFIVRIDGTLDSIMVITSPGPEFSEEAIRLIKDGPAWKPAEENGIAVDNKTRLNIDFK